MKKKIYFITFDPIEFRRRVLNEIQLAQDLNLDIFVLSTSAETIIKSSYNFNYQQIPSLPAFRIGLIRFTVFNFHLLLRILFKKIEVIHFRGIIPMPALLLRQLINKSILIYDAHEYYRGHKIFENRPVRKYVWLWFEKRIIPHLEYLITVSEPLADLFRKDYPECKNVRVIRSLPSRSATAPVKTINLKASAQELLIIFHGYFLPGRALQKIIEAMSLIQEEEIKLLLIGQGPLEEILHKKVKELHLHDRVLFQGFVPNEQLISYLGKAALGLSIIEPDCLNRTYALPNKFFEYIHAGIPVLASNISTLQFYIDKYEIGRAVDPNQIQEIALSIQDMVTNPVKLSQWKANCLLAAQELNWENESKGLADIYKNLCLGTMHK